MKIFELFRYSIIKLFVGKTGHFVIQNAKQLRGKRRSRRKTQFTKPIIMHFQLRQNGRHQTESTQLNCEQSHRYRLIRLIKIHTDGLCKCINGAHSVLLLPYTVIVFWCRQNVANRAKLVVGSAFRCYVAHTYLFIYKYISHIDVHKIII